MNAKRWVAIGAALALFFSSWAAAWISNRLIRDDREPRFFQSMWEQSMVTDEVLVQGDVTRRIAVLEVDGVLVDRGYDFFYPVGYHHQTFMKQLEQVRQDETVQGVLLYVNSPGGGVYESAQIRDKIQQIKKERDIPFYTWMGSMAASGGYYIVAETDRIYASNETLTGSIGVIMSTLNIEGLMEMYGIEDQTVKSGEHKDIASSFRAPTEEERKILQDLIDSAYQRFVTIVQEGRNLSGERLDLVTDGRVFDGAQAIQYGMVDEIGYMEQAMEAMREEYGLHDAQVFRVGKRAIGFWDMLELRLMRVTDRFSLFTPMHSMLGRETAPRAMYVYGGGS